MQSTSAATPEMRRFRLGLLCNEATLTRARGRRQPTRRRALGSTGHAAVLSRAAPASRPAPFDHDRRMSTVLIDDAVHGRLLITKGAPESVLAACVDVAESARATLDAEFAAGGGLWPSQPAPVPGADTITATDEHDLTLSAISSSWTTQTRCRHIPQATRRPRHHRQGRHRRQCRRRREGLS